MLTAKENILLDHMTPLAGNITKKCIATTKSSMDRHGLSEKSARVSLSSMLVGAGNALWAVEDLTGPPKNAPHFYAKPFEQLMKLSILILQNELN